MQVVCNPTVWISVHAITLYSTCIRMSFDSFVEFFSKYHLRNCRQLLNTVTLVLTRRWKCIAFFLHYLLSSKKKSCIFLYTFQISLSLKASLETLKKNLSDNSGKVWLIRTRHTHKPYYQRSVGLRAISLWEILSTRGPRSITRWANITSFIAGDICYTSIYSIKS